MKSILVVEDDEAICEVISLILESEGFKVQVNRDGHLHEGSWKTPPDLILLDIWISDINGGDICTRLKGALNFQKIPIIMMSANSNLRDIAGSCHADDFLPKPFDIDLLISKVNSLVA